MTDEETKRFAQQFVHIVPSPELDSPDEHEVFLQVRNARFRLGLFMNRDGADNCAARAVTMLTELVEALQAD